MTEETLKQMQDRHTLLMAAKDASGVRVYEKDAKYAREVFALGVAIAERQAAEASRPQISRTQLEQLAWLDRLRGVRDADGKPMLLDMGAKGTQFRKNVDTAARRLERGEDLSAIIADTERDLSEKSLALPAPAVDQSAIIQQRAANHVGAGLPPSSAVNLGAGSIHTARTKAL